MGLPDGPNISAPVASYMLIKRPYELLERCYREYGDIFSLKLFRLGRAVFLADPEAIRDVFTKLSRKFNTGETSFFLEPFLGKSSLLLLDGNEHARQRRLIAPAFHGERMRMFGDLMRDCADEAIDHWPVGEVVMIRQEMQAITLRVIVESVFGREMSRRTPEIIEMVRGFLQVPALLMFLPFLRINLGPWSTWGRFLRWREKLDKLLYAEIDRRRANPRPEPEDVLDMLLLSRDEEGRPMTPGEIRDECLTLLLAGHETTALSLTWAFVSLLQSPRVIEKLAEEHRSVVGDGPVTVDMLPKLVYLEATIKESMRINNLFPMVGRRSIEPMEIRGYAIPVGTVVVPCNLLVHQLPSLYPEPKEFRPERFLEEQQHPYGWFPFGGGPRRCIGMNFALFEMKMLLSTILPRVSLELLPGQNFKPERLGLALTPPTGVNVRVKAIKPRPVRTLELVS
jgi:cytochrome P450 family 110